MSISTALPMASPPKSRLGRYRLLSPTASVRVSPLCLGTMNFGEAWEGYMGACDQKRSEEILDFFYQNGGNFIDTSNNYQFEQSEKIIGEWMKKRGNRDEMVVATKFTTNFKSGQGDEQIMINFGGNGTKSLRASVEASLKKLQTDYIDLLYVHWWDFSTSIPELMQSLNQLVTSGKVLYLGVSDTPAWVVSKANQYARDHGLRQFCVYQGRWNAAARDLEREIIPMCRDEGMGIAPWGSLGGGTFKTEAQRQQSSKEGRKVQATEEQIKVSKVLEGIAERNKTHLTSVALAYVMQKQPYVFPIVGGRTVDHLKQNLECLSIRLTEKDFEEIEGAIPFDPGFPNAFLYGPKIPQNPGQVWLMNVAGTTDYVPTPEPVRPTPDE